VSHGRPTAQADAAKRRGLGFEAVLLLSAAALVLVILAIAVAPALGAGSKDLITSTAVAGAPLGVSQAQYTSALGPVSFTTTYTGGVRRISYDHGELSVYLRNGVGFALMTSAKEYRTRAGIGPCSPIASVKRVYGKHLIPVRLPGSKGIVGYRYGHLLFVGPARVVATVMLAADSPANLRLALNAPQCGAGEED
jgi:hypothetical protein